MMPHPVPRPRAATVVPPLEVLVLEDERFDRHRLARLCSGLDRPCALTNAPTLADFDTTLEAARYDLILLDYDLPDGTGLDALEKIRLSARNCTAGLIMVTGHGGTELAQRALDHGCSDYLTKDELSAPAFHRAVANALQKSALALKLESQTFRRTEVEEVLEHFAGQCARDIKPMLSRMMRQVRGLRAPGQDSMQAGTAGIEESCESLWQFALALERHQGKALFDDLKPLSVEAAEASTPRKPPSPFARIVH